jgi:predicted DNA-binding antitoxin AbrB/MazE fold protein
VKHILGAVYENGVFKPLEAPGLPEHQRVLLTVQSPVAAASDADLQAWQEVYSGLSDMDITEIESIALDRKRFMPQGG